MSDQHSRLTQFFTDCPWEMRGGDSMIADSIRIECDEDGFHMIVSGAEGDHDFNVQGIAVELLREIQDKIGSWYAEGEAVREEYMRTKVFACSQEDVDESGGRLTDGGYEKPRAYDRPGSAYAPSDPKHEDFHSIHADLYDNREKGGRCV